jgi:hypothetical protein
MSARVAKFVTLDAPWPWLRQTLGGGGVFGGTRFVFDRACREYDYLVVFNQLPPELNETIDPDRAVFVAAEPACIKRYDARFLGQFGTIITNDRDTWHRNRIFSQVGAPWHIGVSTGQISRYGESLSFDALKGLSGPKSRLVSVICSDKAFTPGHRRRLELVAALREHFGARLDFFGRGLRDFQDKTEALVSYRYHIALENTDASDAWTEKVADPFLAGTFPIYWGCQNLEDYFPADSFARIPIDDHRAAIAAIEDVIAGNRAQAARGALAEAKRRVLFEHNIFGLLDRTLATISVRAAASTPITLRSEPLFAPPSPPPSRLTGIKMRIGAWLGGYPRLLDALRRCYRGAAAIAGGRREKPL